MDSFVPRSFPVWFVVQWVFLAIVIDVVRILNKKKNKNTIAPVIAQHVLSAAHTWVQMAFCITYAYRKSIGLDDDFLEAVGDCAIGMSIAYFVVDAFLILAIDFKRQAPFLIHHAFAIFIGACMSKRMVSLSVTSHYMFMIELSNAFISVWDFLKHHHRGPIYDALTPVFAITYVPPRTVGLAIVTVEFLMSLKTDHGLFRPLAVSLIFILAISWNFSWKISSIGLRSVRARFPRLLTFECTTYLVKAYVTLVWFVWILPQSIDRRPWSVPLGIAVLSVDALHIAASLNYWGTQSQSLLSTALDFSAICTKIAANGLFIYARAFLDGNAPDHTWSCLAMISLACLANDLYDTMFQKDRCLDCFEHRDPSPFLKHFVLSAGIPVLMMPFGKAPYAAVSLYFVGGAVWYMFPKSKSSVGWMHVCVLAGDVALLWWGSF